MMFVGGHLSSFVIGCREGHRPLEVQHMVRRLVEKSWEWDVQMVVVRLDMHRAFDTLSRWDVVEMLRPM
eukprot:3529827-Prorocentrum_lima.AAC.1